MEGYSAVFFTYSYMKFSSLDYKLKQWNTEQYGLL